MDNQNLSKIQKSREYQNVKIIEYTPEFNACYKKLNYEWLKKYFEIEPKDEKILSDPQKQIIEKNGFIFFAILDNKVIGTCTLCKTDETSYELTKMCVTEKYQGKGVGERLLDEAILKARTLHLKKIYLFTNHKLTTAFHLYMKKGFQVFNNHRALCSDYKRVSIYMCLNIEDTTE